jgi:hypothetical protein
VIPYLSSPPRKSQCGLLQSLSPVLRGDQEPVLSRSSHPSVALSPQRIHLTHGPPKLAADTQLLDLSARRRDHLKLLRVTVLILPSSSSTHGFTPRPRGRYSSKLRPLCVLQIRVATLTFAYLLRSGQGPGQYGLIGSLHLECLNLRCNVMLGRWSGEDVK